MGALITLLVLAFIAWAIFTQVMARQQTSVTCSFDPATARRIVSKSFGIWWNSVPGRGDDNYRPKRGPKAPIISISYEAAENGGCHVDIWCSHGIKNYGVLNHAQLMWRKKRAVARALAQAELTLTQASATSSPTSTASPAAAGLPGPQPPTQPAIDPMNGFGAAAGTDRIPPRKPEGRIEAGPRPSLRPAASSGQPTAVSLQPMASSGQRPRGRHSRPDAGAQAPAAAPGVPRTTTRPFPVLETAGGTNWEGRPSRSRMRTGSVDGGAIIAAWLNELEATQPQHGPLLRSTLDRVGNLPAIGDDGNIYTVSHDQYWYAVGFARAYASHQADYRRMHAVLAEATAKETRDELTMVRKEAEAEFWRSVQQWVDSVDPSRMKPDVVPGWLARFNPEWNPVDA